MESSKKAEKAKYDIAYAKSNIKRVPLDMQKADYEALKAAADAKQEKVNEYIKNAIRERMERERQTTGEAGGIFGSPEGVTQV